MYGKIFDTIYDGTLVDDWRALVTFQQMIVLCDADGIIDMTPSAISRRTGIPIEHIKAGIEVLENPDPYSRTDDEEGRRIQRIDEHRPWGWYIVNHNKYKSLRDADTIRAQNRERKRKQRERAKESRSVTPSHAPSRHTDTNTNTDKPKKKGQNRPATAGHFDRWWTQYPRKRKKKTALEIWKRKKLDSRADELIHDVARRLQQDGQWTEGFIPDPTTYLNQERWDDEISPRRQQSGTDDDYVTRMAGMGAFDDN